MHDKMTELEGLMRRRLEAELAELIETSRATAADRAPLELDQQSVGRLSRMDAMQAQAMAAASDQRRRARVARVHAALSRIDDGEYGWCGRCGEAIVERRLELDPTSYLCVGCARLDEVQA